MNDPKVRIPLRSAIRFAFFRSALRPVSPDPSPGSLSRPRRSGFRREGRLRDPEVLIERAERG